MADDGEIARLRELNAEMLEALRQIREWTAHTHSLPWPEGKPSHCVLCAAHAAIIKAENQ